MSLNPQSHTQTEGKLKVHLPVTLWDCHMLCESIYFSSIKVAEKQFLTFKSLKEKECADRIGRFLVWRLNGEKPQLFFYCYNE